jgi:hypothetical protein
VKPWRRKKRRASSLKLQTLERQERDAELAAGGPPSLDQRVTDALPATGRAHADVMEIDHLIGLPPGRLGTADHLGIGIARRFRFQLGEEDETVRILDQLGGRFRGEGAALGGLNQPGKAAAWIA